MLEKLTKMVCAYILKHLVNNEKPIQQEASKVLI